MDLILILMQILILMLIRNFPCYFAKNRFRHRRFPGDLKNSKEAFAVVFVFSIVVSSILNRWNCLKRLFFREFQTSRRNIRRAFFRSEYVLDSISERSQEAFFLEPVLVKVEIPGLQTFNISEKGAAIQSVFF